MATGIPSEEQRRQLAEKRYAAKEAIKKALRDFPERERHKIVGAALTDLDIE